VNPELLGARKQALVERAAVARLHLYRDTRTLRSSFTAPPAVPRHGARFAIGLAVALTGLARGARIVAWMRRGLVAANVSLAVAAFLAARVRNRTDVAGRCAHAGPSTGEQP
jgi:hypothetical protein